MARTKMQERTYAPRCPAIEECQRTARFHFITLILHNADLHDHGLSMVNTNASQTMTTTMNE